MVPADVPADVRVRLHWTDAHDDDDDDVAVDNDAVEESYGNGPDPDSCGPGAHAATGPAGVGSTVGPSRQKRIEAAMPAM